MILASAVLAPTPTSPASSRLAARARSSSAADALMSRLAALSPSSAAALSPAPAAPPRRLAVLLYRPFDLRVDDHPALADAASRGADRLLPVFCLDEARELGAAPRAPRAARAAPPTVLPPPPTGPHRLRFRLEALADLRASLAALGSGLVVRSGAPEDALPRVLEELCVVAPPAAENVSLVFHRRPPSPWLPGDDDGDDDDEEERRVAEAFARACERLGLGRPTVRRHWGAATLHHPVGEVAAWLLGGGGATGTARRRAPEPSPVVDDADGADAAEELLLPHLLPDSFSAYKKALEAGAPRRSDPVIAPSDRKKRPKPPLGALLPSSPPLAAPAGPLPPLPPPFCDAERHGALPDDVHQLYAAHDGSAEALRELSRLCGGGGDHFFGPGKVVPAYACGGGGGGDGGGDGVRHPRADARSAFPFCGGERAAHARLEHVMERVLGAAPVAYGEARAMAADGGRSAGSAKLSAYLAAGCLSPRRVAERLRRRAAERLRRRRRRRQARRGDGEGGDDEEGGEDDEDARWLLSHLVVRDWYVLSGWRERRRRQKRRRKEAGAEAAAASAASAPAAAVAAAAAAAAALPPAFEAWARGRSGPPFVDAAMRELAATGWMSNRSRQLAASALAHDLLPATAAREEEDDDAAEWGGGGGWPLGARVFESLLIDGDRSANRGNWASVAARSRFDPEAQRAKYDPEGALERAWLEEEEEGG